MVLMLVRALIQRIDELDIAVAAQAEHLRHLLLDQIVDDDLGTIEHITRHCVHSLCSLNDMTAQASCRLRASDAPSGARNLFLIILYVN